MDPLRGKVPIPASRTLDSFLKQLLESVSFGTLSVKHPPAASSQDLSSRPTESSPNWSCSHQKATDRAASQREDIFTIPREGSKIARVYRVFHKVECISFKELSFILRQFPVHILVLKRPSFYEMIDNRQWLFCFVFLNTLTKQNKTLPIFVLTFYWSMKSRYLVDNGPTYKP